MIKYCSTAKNEFFCSELYYNPHNCYLQPNPVPQLAGIAQYLDNPSKTMNELSTSFLQTHIINCCVQDLSRRLNQWILNDLPILYQVLKPSSTLQSNINEDTDKTYKIFIANVVKYIENYVANAIEKVGDSIP
ncbi:uncharacterized protein ASCRUDRAFT_10679 [Ascoidea rubescens DSM 1968]|uniref:Uncharacterized protein n=1 Tax=Ascoidea rubescens DSM 1968 TaxID=1344418 RepID=A0A1D2V899_9ASCO|nr:hypothetical protein ASCRUDRAFT_10679 [Ascoidea rubescens DSM 1968]ODV57901.1 hypothetical protein ASCRUDRAFT_10679 [Ascoidea rubescens DSM 1968]